MHQTLSFSCHQGIFIDSLGNIFDGSYKMHQKNGHGTLKSVDGTIIEGTWIDGALDGYAQITTSNGEKYFVHYKAGQVVSKDKITDTPGELRQNDIL